MPISSPDPKIRGRFVYDTLCAVPEMFPQLDADRVRAKIGPKLMGEIEEAKHAYWAPISLDAQLTEAIIAAVKVPRTRDFFRKNLLKSFSSPVFKTLIDTSAHLFKLQLASFARWFRHGFDLVYKDAGEMVVAGVEDVTVVLEWLHVPPGISGKGGYLEGTAGSLEAVFDLAKIPHGRVDLEFDGDQRVARFRMTWR
jgi:hypothetical protein